MVRPYVENIEVDDNETDDDDLQVSSDSEVVEQDEGEDNEEGEADRLLRDLLVKHGYKNRYWRRREQLDLFARAQVYAACVEDFLEEIGCGFKDVLRYLLQERLQPNPNLSSADRTLWMNRKLFCAKDFNRSRAKWFKVLSNLPHSSDKELALAGLACSVFHDRLGFSLWHIARKSDAVQAALSHAEENDDVPSFIDRECAVCHLVFCPHHGMNYQRKNERNEVIAGRSNRKASSRGGSRQANPKGKPNWYISSDEEEINNVVRPRPLRKEMQHLENIERPLGINHWLRTHKPDDVKQRKPFQPCNHNGPCPGRGANFEDCRCAREGIPCEKFCGCDNSCPRRYPGCDCAELHLPCSTDLCPCLQLDRECDPDLCHSCHAVDVLDPESHRESSDRDCQNVNIQLGKRKNTKIGGSAVKGFGLFTMEPIEPDEFIGEYVGETMTINQLIRKQSITNYMQENTYIFDINPGEFTSCRSRISN